MSASDRSRGVARPARLPPSRRLSSVVHTRSVAQGDSPSPAALAASTSASTSRLATWCRTSSPKGTAALAQYRHVNSASRKKPKAGRQKAWSMGTIPRRPPPPRAPVTSTLPSCRSQLKRRESRTLSRWLCASSNSEPSKRNSLASPTASPTNSWMLPHCSVRCLPVLERSSRLSNAVRGTPAKPRSSLYATRSRTAPPPGRNPSRITCSDRPRGLFSLPASSSAGLKTATGGRGTPSELSRIR
mmetsp:Transcript_1713/g.5545  ORF Transcript_1713/g.5545 Transcript_1713/m.5545 type:complete len:244 (-) Transcript_1713:548-1279(-)